MQTTYYIGGMSLSINVNLLVMTEHKNYVVFKFNLWFEFFLNQFKIFKPV